MVVRELLLDMHGDVTCQPRQTCVDFGMYLLFEFRHNVTAWCPTDRLSILHCILYVGSSPTQCKDPNAEPFIFSYNAFRFLVFAWVPSI